MDTELTLNFIIGGFTFLVGMLLGYFLFTTWWMILTTLGSYIITAILIQLLKRYWNKRKERQCSGSL